MLQQYTIYSMNRAPNMKKHSTVTWALQQEFLGITTHTYVQVLSSQKSCEKKYKSSSCTKNALTHTVSFHPNYHEFSEYEETRII